MLPENKQNEQKFDQMLKKALKKHCEPIRKDFAHDFLAKIQTVEQQNVLRKVIRQERMLLAACISLPIGAIVMMLVFPNLLLVPTQLLETLYLLAKETAANMAQHWRLWIYYAIAAIAVIYAFYESLLADN